MRQNTEFKILTSYVRPDPSQKTPLRSEDSVDTDTSLAAFKIYGKHNGKEAIINLRSNKKLDDFKPQLNYYIFTDVI